MKEKIGIISDTHGLLRPEVLEILKDCKYILHAGDVNKDEILDVLRSMGNLYVVRGNNDKDWAENLRTSLSFTIGGVKFFMVHNKKDIAWELGDTQVVIFGHTHKYFEKMIDGRMWLNPGSCGRSPAFLQQISCPAAAGKLSSLFLAACHQILGIHSGRQHDCQDPRGLCQSLLPV